MYYFMLITPEFLGYASCALISFVQALVGITPKNYGTSKQDEPLAAVMPNFVKGILHARRGQLQNRCAAFAGDEQMRLGC